MREVQALSERMEIVAKRFAPNERDLSLASGQALGALLCDTLFRLTGSTHWRERGADHLRTAARSIQYGLNTSFYLGAPGYAWVAATTARSLEYEEGQDIADEIGQAMSAAIERGGNIAYDLIHGLTGMSVLARACSDETRDQLLTSSWNALCARCASKVPGFSWLSAGEDIGANLGLAHGIPGVLAGFAAAAASGWSHANAREALVRGGEWLAEGGRSGADTGHVAYRDGEPDVARLAWCYGHPSLANSFLWLAKLDPRFAVHARLSIRKSLLARSGNAHCLGDVCICHGHSGWAYLATRFSEAIGTSEPCSPVLRQSAELALAQVDMTLSATQPDLRTVNLTGDGEVMFDSLLEGTEGVLLALAGIADVRLRSWQGAMLLDFPSLVAT